MYDLITVGSATLDIVAKSKDFMIKEVDGDTVMCERFGEKMDIEVLKFITGGGATNVGVGASRLGLKTAVVCEVGKDFAGQAVIEDLRKEHVATEFVVAERLEETAVSILLACGDGGRTALTHRGAAYQLESRDIPWQQLANTRWLHIGSLGSDKRVLYDLFEFAQLHRLSVSWTPSLVNLHFFAHKDLSPESIYCSVLVLNKDEWAIIQDIHSQLLDRIETVIVTAGKEGGEVFQHGRKLTDYASLSVETIEETGAGDAFCTGFISGQIMNKDVNESLDWAKKNAASVVQYLGAKAGLLAIKSIV
jgi:ribokinase